MRPDQGSSKVQEPPKLADAIIQLVCESEGGVAAEVLV